MSSLFDVQAAGGVDDRDVALSRAKATAVARDVDGVDVGAGRVDRHADPFGERDELVHRGRTVDVGGDFGSAWLRQQQAGELGGRGRLTRALEAGAKEDGGRPPAEERGLVAGPTRATSSSSTIFTTCWAGAEAFHDLDAQAPRLTRSRTSSQA